MGQNTTKAEAEAEAILGLRRNDYLRKQVAFDEALAALEAASRLYCEAANHLDNIRGQNEAQAEVTKLRAELAAARADNT